MIENSRRTFLKSGFLSTAVLLFSNGEVLGAVTPLQTLAVVQEDIFPQATILKSNAYAYISTILHHSRVNDEDKEFLRNGVGWLNEEALKIHKKLYTELNSVQREDVLKFISQERWGESWIERVLTYIMEAMLGDPIYGVNKNENGWKWLNHESGLPRPKEALL